MRPEVLKQTINPDGRIVQKLEKPIQVELMEKLEMGCDNSFVYRFALPGRTSVLGHKTCQYLEFETNIKNKDTGESESMTRYYHPMSKVHDEGSIDLLIKVYLRDFKFPKGGAFT